MSVISSVMKRVTGTHQSLLDSTLVKQVGMKGVTSALASNVGVMGVLGGGVGYLSSNNDTSSEIKGAAFGALMGGMFGATVTAGLLKNANDTANRFIKDSKYRLMLEPRAKNIAGNSVIGVGGGAILGGAMGATVSDNNNKLTGFTAGAIGGATLGGVAGRYGTAFKKNALAGKRQILSDVNYFYKPIKNWKKNKASNVLDSNSPIQRTKPVVNKSTWAAGTGGRAHHPRVEEAPAKVASNVPIQKIESNVPVQKIESSVPVQKIESTPEVSSQSQKVEEAIPYKMSPEAEERQRVRLAADAIKMKKNYEERIKSAYKEFQEVKDSPKNPVFARRKEYFEGMKQHYAEKYGHDWKLE